MRHLIEIVLLSQVVLLSLFAATLAASARSRGKKKVTKETKEVNICDIEGQQSPIYCYCDSTRLRNATEAKCVVFRGYKADDPMWGYFTSQPHLTKLQFTVRTPGSLDFVPSEMLKQLQNVQSVTFEYATIHELAQHAFYILPSVSEISLSRNSIVTLHKYAFDSMKNLSLINLDENRVAEINRNVFFNVPSLKTLLLNANNISTVHDKAFEHLSNLQELELSSNQIAVITSDTFYGLKSLQKLDLRNNRLSMIGDRSFVEMPELRELELDQNAIEYVSPKALHGLRNLWKLRLSENKLVTLESNFLDGTPGLYFLDLRHNLLRTMTFDNVKPIVTNLYNATSHFYLDGNKLICDCKLAWIWGLRNETNNTKLRNALEELTCYLESNNDTFKSNSEDAERNQALEIARNPEEYRIDNYKRTEEDTSYMGDVGNDEYYEDYEDEDEDVANAQPKAEVIEGKLWHVERLLALKLEDLPCPEPSREDLMASEQPSGRHVNAPIGSSIWFSSAPAAAAPTTRSVLLACPLILLLSILFT